MGAVTRISYHFVLVTKYRQRALTGIEQAVYQAMQDVAEHSSFSITDMNIEDGNHIHLVIEASPTYSVAGYVNRIKAMTTQRLWDNPDTAEHLRQFYWGKRRLWHGGYFASSIGDVAAEVVLNYVKKQNGPRPKAIHRRG